MESNDSPEIPDRRETSDSPPGPHYGDTDDSGGHGMIFLTLTVTASAPCLHQNAGITVGVAVDDVVGGTRVAQAAVTSGAWTVTGSTEHLSTGSATSFRYDNNNDHHRHPCLEKLIAIPVSPSVRPPIQIGLFQPQRSVGVGVRVGVGV